MTLFFVSKQGGKERGKKYYQENKEAIKKRKRDKYKMMSEEDKNKIRERSRNRYYKLKGQYKG